jgi:tetratricopeptide (TPR) repeat protein
VLTEHPLRPHARLLLMRALERTGRRAEALAAYDVGRQLLAEQTGLAPAAALQDEFEQLLAAEQRSAHRDRLMVRAQRIPPGAAETARWLAREGSTSAALELALRGCWWWWLGGGRSAGRDLLQELTGFSEPTDPDSPAVLGATAWLSVFDAVTETAERAIATGETSLRRALDLGWGRPESLAALLLAERLFQRGEPDRADLLLQAGRNQLDRARDQWGLAVAALVAAKRDLQRGAIARAAQGGREACRAFGQLADPAGQMMALDHIGYCAEICGDLAASARIHHQALELAGQVDAPEWQATQLTRLGSVQALRGDDAALATLRRAASLARSVGSAAGAALAENGLGLAHGLTGDRDRAASIHASTLHWYERQASRAGVSYTAGRLALSLADHDTEHALALATRSRALAIQTRDPRAIAHALEALAVTHPDAPTQARSLGGARALRRRTRAPLPAAIATAIGRLQPDLEAQLGGALPAHLREGAREAQPWMAMPA